MRENCTSGTVEGAPGNGCSYSVMLPGYIVEYLLVKISYAITFFLELKANVFSE